MYFGETVFEVIRQAGLQGSVGGEFRGGALAVDIADAGTLFLTLSNDWPLWIAHEVFGPRIGGAKTVDHEQLHRLAHMQGASGSIPIHNYADNDLKRVGRAPVEYFVRFADTAVPTSVTKVDPFDLARDFGSDTSLHSLRLEITDRDKPTDIYRRLPWLREQRGALLKSPVGVAIGDMPFAARLTDGDFAQNVKLSLMDRLMNVP